MCDFCGKHGQGNRWYLNSDDSSEKMMEDPPAREEPREGGGVRHRLLHRFHLPGHPAHQLAGHREDGEDRRRPDQWPTRGGARESAPYDVYIMDAMDACPGSEVGRTVSYVYPLAASVQPARGFLRLICIPAYGVYILFMLVHAGRFIPAHIAWQGESTSLRRDRVWR